ncbi:PLP-dependent aminotransferase family protein [Pectinatus frisingensis]|uniref:aminotransferase-like domain-containing protein n=1 Tax=Pectinatus frisingensis TaxID=865 RepID=UPI0018C45A24|nr:PLP-dependent aminotransferase family protein [Pectinatus frisingensis]
MNIIFSQRMDSLKASEIREILKVTSKPEIISFAGGLPAPELFPIKELKDISVKVLNESGSQALQYSTTEGFTPLRKQIASRMNRKFHTIIDFDNILITAGSQQALDLSGKLFLNKDDIVLCESPTYLAALSAFKAYEPKLLGVDTDNDGMIINKLEKTIQTNSNVKFMYVIPDFQNPTGRTWSVQRRKELVDIANRYHIPIIEDNPYGELRFDRNILPSIKSFDTKGLVIFVSTFSKTFCPGMRIGWIAADQKLIEKYVLLKQGADLHTSSISQREISKYIELYDFDEHIKKIINVYRERRNTILSAMQENFPAEVKFTRPQGGLFTWVELPLHINGKELLMHCLRDNVAFVPGEPFFPDRKVFNAIRLNYSNMPKDRIVLGIRRIANILHNIYNI